MILILFLPLVSWSSSHLSVPHSSLFLQNKSHKAYLLYKNKQNQFKNKQEKALQVRRKEMKKIRKAKQIQNRVEDLEYKSHIQPDFVPSLEKHLSNQEEAFLEHQNKQRGFEIFRRRVFSKYKQESQSYKNRQRVILANRLKKIQVLRNKIDLVEISPIEAF